MSFQRDLIRSLDGFRQIWLVLQDVRFIDPVEKFCRTSVDPAHREVLKLSRAWIGGWFPFGLLLDRRLNTIVFRDVNFKGINNIQRIFEQLNVLEFVHIFYLNTRFTQQNINLAKPFKLKSLFINEELQIESL
ncbi:hypothetical protein RhiirC2_798055 [Rhizophagus irregularis]|uniref:Uncharacterized protein n=1 Tax=Rhizophagus irregularis TaxID=588596 RepID=A0A2N1M707_9GLOM|nr:hypothetical protein RhiirC2_798055 [Rhizophagus irregularis]